MGKCRVEYLPLAVADLDEIFDYVAADNQSAAVSLLNDIDTAILHLQDFPLIGAIPKNRRLARQGYHILVAESYLVFYVIPDDETVEIRRILNGKREYKFLL